MPLNMHFPLMMRWKTFFKSVENMEDVSYDNIISWLKYLDRYG